MPKPLYLVGACTGALLCSSFIGVRADEASTPTTTVVKVKPLQGITSLSVDFPTSSPRDAKALLDTTVSFAVKDASFAVALDGLLNASGKTCQIECRKVKPMKLTFSALDAKAGDVLNALAKAGGCGLYVFPDKLLISPPDLLLKEEKGEAPPYKVLLPGSSALNITRAGVLGNVNVATAARTLISTSFSDVPVSDAVLNVAKSTSTPVRVDYRSPLSRWVDGVVPANISLSLDQTTFGDALDIVANMGGCTVYVLPDRFLVTSPEMLTPDEKKVAVPAFTSNKGGPIDLSSPAA